MKQIQIHELTKSLYMVFFSINQIWIWIIYLQFSEFQLV